VGNPTQRGPSGGLGIGLALVRHLVEMHGGHVEARSEGLGCGSEFVVRLPYAAKREDEPASHAVRHGAIAPHRILVVDDNADAGDSLGLLLETLGAEVLVARDGASALEAFKAFDPKIVLLDIGMTGMDGYEVARRIRAGFPERRATIVALTGWGQERDRQLAREAGFDHHLLKPADPAALRELLDRVR
jgi:CheY-like chemotaxis protein